MIQKNIFSWEITLHLVYIGFSRDLSNLFLSKIEKRWANNKQSLCIRCYLWGTLILLKEVIKFDCHKYDYICFLNKMLLCCNWTIHLLFVYLVPQTHVLFIDVWEEKNFGLIIILSIFNKSDSPFFISEQVTEWFHFFFHLVNSDLQKPQYTAFVSPPAGFYAFNVCMPIHWWENISFLQVFLFPSWSILSWFLVLVRFH